MGALITGLFHVAIKTNDLDRSVRASALAAGG